MASTSDNIVSALSNLGSVGTALAIAAVPVAAGIATYVTRMGSQGKIDSLQGELDRAKTESGATLAEAERRYADLDGRYQAILRSGALIQTQLDTIVSEAADLASRLDAEDYSVLVPAPTSIPGDQPDQLVFLCMSGDQAAKLKWVRVPIATSLAGKVFVNGSTAIATPPESGDSFSRRTDQVADYKTKEVLSVCLRHRGQSIGVAQFLNKRGGRRFGSDDRERAQTQSAVLAIRVADFLSDPRRLTELGHAPRQNEIDATLMMIDLSHFSALFGRLDSSIVTDLLNEYFAELCGIALHQGAAIDKFIGDGALLTFNVQQRQDGHEGKAVAAALDMRAAFRNLRERWKVIGYAGADRLFVRIGLSCGTVTRAEIGYMASRLTVIGAAVNAAAYACKIGPRDHDAVLVTQTFRDRLGPATQIETRAVAQEADILEVLT
jgi:class 3 adenylate cyclase